MRDEEFYTIVSFSLFFLEKKGRQKKVQTLNIRTSLVLIMDF